MNKYITPEQQSYINSNIENHIFLEACPGSGKTEVIAQKIAKELLNWQKSPGGIAILSFSNSATDELKNRIYSYLPNETSLFPHIISTFDSFIYKNIVNPLAHSITEYEGADGDFTIKIVDRSSYIGFSNPLPKYGSIAANHYFFKNNKIHFNTGDTKRNNQLMLITFQDWQIKKLQETKMKMINAGYATYADIENLTLQALQDTELQTYWKNFALRFPLIIIDECQDLSETELQILTKLIDIGIKLHLIGDMNQSIYGFRRAEPKLVKEFVKQHHFKHLELTQNFRSCDKIVSLCNRLIKSNNIQGQYSNIAPSCILLEYDDCRTELTSIFQQLSSPYSHTVIIARSHAVLSKFNRTIKELKTIEKLAIAIYTFDSANLESLVNSFTYYSDFIQNELDLPSRPNSFHCPQTIESQLIWRQFLLHSLTYLKNDAINDHRDITWSQWIRSIKQRIRSIPLQSFVHNDLSPIIDKLKESSPRAPNGKANSNISDIFLNMPSEVSIHRKDTIHGVKGETHDMTILVSSDDARGSNGSHWKSWIKNDGSEMARFAYVASSRPKHKLIWAVKRLKTKERKQLIDLGFIIHT